MRSLNTRTIVLLSVAFAVVMVAAGLSTRTGATDDPNAEPRVDERRVCTAIGCDSGVFVTVTKIRNRLPEARRITVCAAGRCRTFGRRIDLASVRLARVERERRVRVRLVVRDGDGDRLHRDRIRVRLRRHQPNGRGCPPVCYSCGLGLDADLNLNKRGR